MMADDWDMIVVGAGWFGLSAAKAYLQLHPNERLLVLEAESSCGGTWGADRLYPALKSNNLYDSYEHPDMPMDEATYGVKPGQHIPGTVLHRYLTDFAKKFGVFERVRFHTRVVELSPNGQGWKLEVVTGEKEYFLTTAKIIIATGMTSTPNIPQYAGQETFDGPIFHAKDFCRNGDTVKTAQNVTIVGGAKSAYDVAWAYANAGAKVNLVIRPGGNGPVWLAPSMVMGGTKRIDKLLHIRFMSWFSPCPWGQEDGFSWPRRFLHGTAIGRFIVRQFWKALGDDVIELNGFKKDPLVGQLKPWHDAFWIGSGLSVHNFETNFFDMVKTGQVKVHIADIDHLSANTVHLANDTHTTLPSDLLILSTGWKKEPSIQLRLGPLGIGLPHTPTAQSHLATAADTALLTRFPALRNQPPLNYKLPNDPFRLYRFMIPPTYMDTRNIAFAGLLSNVSTSICAAVQALWISAYFDGKLDRLAQGEKEVAEEVMLHTQWGRWRHPIGYGAKIPDFAFDGLPYLDMLVRDLGCGVHRKRGWYRELFEPVGPEDYRGLMREWRERHR